MQVFSTQEIKKATSNLAANSAEEDDEPIEPGNPKKKRRRRKKKKGGAAPSDAAVPVPKRTEPIQLDLMAIIAGQKAASEAAKAKKLAKRDPTVLKKKNLATVLGMWK